MYSIHQCSMYRYIKFQPEIPGSYGGVARHTETHRGPSAINNIGDYDNLEIFFSLSQNFSILRHAENAQSINNHF